MIASTGTAGIIGLSVGWGIVAIFLIITIVMLSGKGSRLVSGFNTMSESEKSRYNKRKISKNAGKTMLIVDVVLIAFMIILQFTWSAQMLMYSSIIFSACVVAIGIVAATGGFRKSTK